MWKEISPIIPARKSKVGRPEECNKKAFLGIAYVMKTGCQWEYLPTEYGKKSTVHGKYMKWCREGVFDAIMKKIRALYQEKNQDNIWYAIDTSSKKAPFAKFGGKNPTDRSKRGVKQVIIVDRKGAPVHAQIAPANTHDSKLLIPIVQEMKSSEKVLILAADSAFDAKKLRRFCASKKIALNASPNKRRSKKVRKIKVLHRWIVERTFGWISWFRGLKICWAKFELSHLAFLQLSASIQLFRML